MESRPEYVGIWLGLAKAGIVSALINTNLKGDTLVHSVTCVKSRALIYGDGETTAAAEQSISVLASQRKMDFFVFADKPRNVSGSNVNSLKALLAESSDKFESSRMRGCFTDKLFYVYTSGTTGMPKAAIIKHCRYFFFGAGCNKLVGLGSQQTIYISLPLYHLAGGAIGTCQCLVFGNTLAVRNKFSASRFCECVRRDYDALSMRLHSKRECRD